MIHPEKRKAIEDALALCLNNKEKLIKVLARQHGVGISTIQLWDKQRRDKMTVPKAQTPKLYEQAAIPPIVPVSMASGVSPYNAAWLQHLAAQALFLAEQLKSLANNQR